MKKSIIAAVLTGVVLLAGCSSVSEESYNAVVAENESLKSEKESLEIKSHTTSEDYYKGVALNIVECMSHDFSLEKTENQDGVSWQIKNAKINGDIYSVITCRVANDSEMARYVCAVSSSIMESSLYLCQSNVKGMVYIFEKSNGDVAATGVFSIDSTKVDIDITSTNIDEVTKFKVLTVDDGLNSEIKKIFNNNLLPTTYIPAPIIENADSNTTSGSTSNIYSPSSSAQTESSDTSQPAVSSDNNQSSASVPTQSTQLPEQTESPAQTNTPTTGERNAVKKAQSYLDFTAFSRDGLIGQLEFEGFTKSEATYGADNVGANWNEQAVKKAKDYLEFTAFSYSGLVEQLEFEEFTHEQAVYGADKCGANWNEQAAKKAESYLELMAFSRDSLIEQLEFEGFTHEQAVYGAAQNGY